MKMHSLESKMKEEIRNTKNSYDKVKKLLRESISIEEFIQDRNLKKEDVKKHLLIIQENILLIPIVDKNVELDKILEKIDFLVKGSKNVKH